MTLRLDAAESAVNTVLGLAIGWAVLRAFGMSTGQAIVVQGVFITASFVRSFAVRRLFRWIGRP
jgi:ABC-type nickel/cobalt efflux system permease component RcnA